MKSLSKSEKYAEMINAAQSINDFDYNKMMSEFELRDRQKVIKKRNQKKWANDNEFYSSKISSMKTKVDQQTKDRNKELIKKFRTKDQQIMEAIKGIQSVKNEEKRKAIELLIQKENDAKNNISMNQQALEEQLEREKQRTIEKITSFEERALIKKKEMKDKFVNQLLMKDLKYQENWQKHLLQKEEAIKLREAKSFTKYESFYWQKREIDKQHKDFKKKNYDKTQAKEERLEQLELKQSKTKKQIEKKIKEMVIKKEEYEKKRNNQIENENYQRQLKFERVQSNLSVLEEERRYKCQTILDYERSLIARSVDRDSLHSLKRVNSQDDLILQHKIEGMNYRDFIKKLESIKSESVLKKSYNERYKIYRQKKQAELEAKKKADEDKENQKYK